jgi:hypothetical protein
MLSRCLDDANRLLAPVLAGLGEHVAQVHAGSRFHRTRLLGRRAGHSSDEEDQNYRRSQHRAHASYS